jgi:hypothetical protein
MEDSSGIEIVASLRAIHHDGYEYLLFDDVVALLGQYSSAHRRAGTSVIADELERIAAKLLGADHI